MVTLLTGDRVELFSKDGRRAVIHPGKGREHMKFKTQRIRDHLYVVPADASRLLRSGKLDRRIFDVLALVRAGYADNRSQTLGLLFSYGKNQTKSLRTNGITSVRNISAVNVESVRVAKAKAGSVWPELLKAKGIERFWLNGKRRVNLHESVPQIGAPDAWQAGFTGKGVTVAVIDTGVDSTHPDLAGKVSAVKDFTGEGPADLFGHGTHVASIVGGTAKGSKGKYKGVAPDAKLVSAKVCDSGGWCTDEAILGGMEWASVTQKAKVANLSLGGGDTPEIDPLEDAVDKLTAKTGTLFVISAGNDGPGAETVSSPGSADAALTVGAVDKKDKLAYFSSVGPRVGDGAIKPDVTAPGVEIAAGRAKGTELGDPVADYPNYYVYLSGTSMAAPHAAGSAALLAQQHPTWKAAELKGVLMASALPMRGQSVFQQGAGRISVSDAINQSLISVPGSVSFGTVLWPHTDDAPVVKTLAYRNLGAEAVTISLSASMSGPNGKPAPAGALALSANTLTIPAGGTGSVKVTSNTKHTGPDGVYSGRVIARTDDGQVATPLAVTKEVESYDVKVNHIDQTGKATSAFFDTSFGVNSGDMEWIWEEKPVAELRLPKGRYLYSSDVELEVDGVFTFYRTVWPNILVDRPLTLTSDARKAKPVSVSVQRDSARVNLAEIGFTRVAHTPDGKYTWDSAVLSDSYDGLYTAHAGPAAPAKDMAGRVSGQFGEPGPDDDFMNSPYIYLLSWFVPGRMPTGFTKAVKDSELAQVAHDQGIQVTKRLGSYVGFNVNENDFGGWSTLWYSDLPSTITRFHTTEGQRWAGEVGEFVLDPDGFPMDQVILSSDYRSLPSGKSREVWNRGVFGPAFPRSGGYPWADRTKDFIYAGIPLYSDQHGHAGFSRTDKASSRLFRNGKKVGESTFAGYVEADVPAGPATFLLETSATRGKVSDYSTTVKAAWTFRSAHAAKTTPLPLWAVRFQPKVDDHSISHQGPKHTVPVRVEAQRGSSVGQLTTVSVEVSADDGKTWKKGVLTPGGPSSWTLSVDVPLTTDYVSLRAKATDSKGNSVTQTLIRAYAIAP